MTVETSSSSQILIGQ